MPAFHSASVGATSRMKPCRCLTRPLTTSLRRGSSVALEAVDHGSGQRAIRELRHASLQAPPVDAVSGTPGSETTVWPPCGRGGRPRRCCLPEPACHCPARTVSSVGLPPEHAGHRRPSLRHDAILTTGARESGSSRRTALTVGSGFRQRTGEVRGLPPRARGRTRPQPRRSRPPSGTAGARRGSPR